MVIPHLGRDSARENKNQSGKKKQKSGNSVFGMLLDSEQERVKQSDIRVTATGYSKDARTVNLLYQTREYA